MSQKPSIPQGTRDFGPEVMLRRERIFDTLRRCFRKRGFLPLETPSMEKLSVLTGKYGEEGDQLIFKILNNGDFLKDAKDLHDSQKLAFQISEKALRYDLTVPFARFVVMHQNELTFPFKRYQIQPVWRGDRPGKGRYREFFQCDADVVGSDSLLYEAEFINLFDEALTELGLPGFSILINNRKILSGYAELAGTPEKTTDICTAIDKLDKIGQEGVIKELTERGISAENAAMLLELIAFSPDDATLSQDQINQARLAYLKTRFAPGSTGYQGVEEMEEIFALSQHFPSYKGTLTFDLSLARGLNYYTGAIFEVKAHGVAIGSICGGGRYADLTGVFGLKGLSGVGISFGADRIYDVMEALGLFGDLSTAPVQVMIVNFG
ncbi:MAG: histidine--tRNA ligase, partial [Bacteroidetes bacterium]